jgi:hypothetical protein
MDEEKDTYIHCSNCKKYQSNDNFIKPNGGFYKMCQTCRDRSKINRQNNKCEHDRERSRCKDCGGGSICEHGRRRSRCKDCGGGSICEHDRERSSCKDCGGASICEHNIQRSYCKDCGGSQICEHDRERSKCKDCDIIGYIRHIQASRIRDALKAKKLKSTIDYLGCSIEEFKTHIEQQFKEGMSWDNHGEWHIDHIIPIKYGNPTIEELFERLHWTNTQPLWASDNKSKGNRFIG